MDFAVCAQLLALVTLSPFCALTHKMLPAVFQQLETDYCISPPNKNIHPTDLVEVPVIRMFGCTEQGEYEVLLKIQSIGSSCCGKGCLSLLS